MKHTARKRIIEVARANGDTICRITITRNAVTSHVEWYVVDRLSYEDEQLFRAQIAFSGPGVELRRLIDRYRKEGGRHGIVHFTPSTGRIMSVSHELAEQIAEVVVRHIEDAVELVDPVPEDAPEALAEHIRFWRDCIRAYADIDDEPARAN
ncbi:hypothetical protein [Methylocaldum sp.]|uniref:hypothetical protein n=1 Tax=Methylocaldum sp. TaxID=1969727 RepID=UPI002D58C855|nr:hypothetical protein [Methylocaldum sp.]HYE35662.1 hypothetical protein [Methylocaldum sp.]